MPGTVERVERTAKVVESRPRIGDPHDDLFALPVSFHQDFLFLHLFQGLDGVAEKIDEYLLEYQLRNRGIRVEMNFGANLPKIASNEGQFKQVFVNLFSNSVKALEQVQKKKILVEGYREGEKVIVRIADSGPGFNDLSRAFDPFYSTRPVGQGTGLGLSICYGTVREHNGNIYVKNLQPNGAAVTIELPVG